MNAGSFRRSRLVVAAATVLSGLAMSAGASAHASGEYTTNCPKAETYVPRATWQHRTLMQGVVLSEGRARDSRGIVDMHVLTVDMTNLNIHFQPLLRHLAERTPLSSLAAGRPKLVAATNTGYFDFYVGAPFGPVAYGGVPFTGTAAGSSYVGFGSDHRVYTGTVHLASSIVVNGVTKPLKGLNLMSLPYGLTIYTPRWGSQSVQVPWDAAARYLTNGVISSGTKRYSSPPATGQMMLVARGTTAISWLKSLPQGTVVKPHFGYTTDAPVKIGQAYGVGEEIVQRSGVVRTGLACRIRYPMPARNAVGWNNYHKRLIIAVVTDIPGTNVHGLDADQMSKLMVELGAARAYLWDGSGSAEMIARMPSTGALSIRNQPADGQERPMPVGLGIFRS